MSYKDYDEINVLETNLDDCTGEVLGRVMEILFLEGAKDVFYTSIFMKKNRPAYKLTVLCKDEEVDKIEDIIFNETTAIGIRKRKEQRTILKRRFDTVETPFGKIKAKVVLRQDGEKYYPEYDNVREVSESCKVSVKEIYNWFSNNL